MRSTRTLKGLFEEAANNPSAHEAGALLDARQLGQWAIDPRPLPDALGSLFKSIRAQLLSRLKLKGAG